MSNPSRAFDPSRFVATSAGRVPGVQVYIPKTAFRIHPDRSRSIINVYLSRTSDKWWLIDAELVEEGHSQIPGLWRADLYEGVTTEGQPFLLPPVTQPLQANKNTYHETLTDAVKLARKKWITVELNKAHQCFDVSCEKAMKAEPDGWSDCDFSDVLEEAFRGRIICTDKDVMAKLKRPSRREINENDEE